MFKFNLGFEAFLYSTSHAWRILSSVRSPVFITATRLPSNHPSLKEQSYPSLPCFFNMKTSGDAKEGDTFRGPQHWCLTTQLHPASLQGICEAPESLTWGPSLLDTRTAEDTEAEEAPLTVCSSIYKIPGTAHSFKSAWWCWAKQLTEQIK